MLRPKISMYKIFYVVGDIVNTRMKKYLHILKFEIFSFSTLETRFCIIFYCINFPISNLNIDVYET